jgi:hypothetical protein
LLWYEQEFLMRFRFGAALALSSLVLAACAASQPAQPTAMPFQTTPVAVTPTTQAATGAYPYPAPPAANTTDQAYPGPATSRDPQGRALSALAALPLAQKDAQANFDPNAKLYAILPSQAMIQNLGSLPVAPGWFYKFKLDGSAREYIVQVVDNQVTGTREIEPIQAPKPLELQIDPASVKIDSDQVFASFKEKAPSLSLSVDDPKKYDLELINLEGGSGPVWSVFDPGKHTWLYSVSATSGSEVSNPRG